jgi:hypothetical protein
MGRIVRRFVFWITYALASVAPLYVPVAVVMGSLGVQALLVLAPVFLLFVPSAHYLLLMTCDSCHKRVYTAAHLRSASKRTWAFVPPFFSRCPECGHPVVHD